MFRTSAKALKSLHPNLFSNPSNSSSALKDSEDDEGLAAESPRALGSTEHEHERTNWKVRQKLNLPSTCDLYHM